MDAAYDSPKGTVRRYKRGQRHGPCHNGNYEKYQHRISYPFFLRFMVEAEFLAFAVSAQPRDDVLHDAHGAYNRAVDASEDEGQRYKGRDDDDVAGHQRGQELDACRPSQPGVHGAGEVEEERRHADPEQHRQRTSDFSEHNGGQIVKIVFRKGRSRLSVKTNGLDALPYDVFANL